MSILLHLPVFVKYLALNCAWISYSNSVFALLDVHGGVRERLTVDRHHRTNYFRVYRFSANTDFPAIVL